MHLSKYILFFLLITLNGFSKDTQSPTSQIEILSYLKEKLVKSERKFLIKSNICREKNANRKVKIDWSKIHDSQEDVSNAILYIFFRNKYLCSDIERKKYFYDLVRLQAFKKEQHLDSKEERGKMRTFTIWGHPIDELSIKYLKITLKTRRYLEEMIGKEIFDIKDTISKMHP